jgi:hypothetical protein
MAKKTTTREGSGSRTLKIEDLDQIVGGATATHQQYDTTKQSLLSEINNADITNAVAADAASIASNPTSAATIASAIQNIEAQAATDHVSQVAALAALDAATYGNAKVGGNDAIAGELTRVLTNGTGEADLAHVAAIGAIDPATLVKELDQAIQVLAMGSSNGQTALGLQTSAATDWVEAKLVTAAANEATQDNAAAAIVPVAEPTVGYGSTDNSNSPQAQAYAAQYQTDITEAHNATAFQSFLNVQHQGEVAEGNAIIAIEAALGGNLSAIQQDATALQGMTGTAAQAEITAAEHTAGLPNEVTLAALELFTQGNASVQQTLSGELNNLSLEMNLANAVATGAITGSLAVQTLNLIVTDLSTDSVNAATVPSMELGFAAASADSMLATDAAFIAATDTTAAAANTQYNPNLAATDAHQAQLATGLATLLNTTYASEIALSNEITTLKNELGPYASTILSDAGNLTAGNTTLAQQYIAAIEAKAAAAEAAATPGSTAATFSVDAALALLAIYSNGNSTVLSALETRLVNGMAEQDLANLVALGAMPATQAVAILTQAVDTLAANSPNNSVTLVGADNQAITVDRTSAEDWALGQFAKYALPMLNNMAQDMTGLAQAIASFNSSAATAEANALKIAIEEAGNVAQLAALLEGADAQQVVEGLGIDTVWATSSAAGDAAAAIAAGTTWVQTSYGPEAQVSAAAQAQAAAFQSAGDQRELANLALAQEVMQGYLTGIWNQNIAGGQQSDAAIVEADAQSFYLNFAVPAAEYSYGVGADALTEWGITAVYQSEQAFQGDPNLQNFMDLALNSGMIFKGPFPQAANIVDFGLQAMAALMQEGAVSDVIGTEAAGDLGTSFQVLHDAIAGTMNMFSDTILAYGQTAVLLTDDAITVGENSFSLANDLFHGNTGSLGSDAVTLFENIGKGLLDETLADYGMRNYFVPIQDVIPLATDLAQQLIGLETDFMNNSDFASAVGAIQTEAQALVTDIGNLLPSNVDSFISSSFGAIESTLSKGLSDAESWADDAWSWISGL